MTEGEQLALLEETAQDVCAGIFLPPPRLSGSAWSDEYAVIPKQSGSAEPGRWRTSRVPFLGEILDAMVGTPQEVVVMKAERVGYTACLTNAIACWMDQDPSKILLVQPDKQTAQDWSRDYLGPVLEETPKIQGLVRAFGEGGARYAGNTTFRKEYPGGSISSAWASSANRLRFATIRRVLLDEIDAYQDNEKEGDVLARAEKRTETFGRRRKIIKGSKPTIKGRSRIERAFLLSDQRYYFVPCPHCKHAQRFVWANVRWEAGQPETAHYLCANCGDKIDHHAKQRMLRAGRWIAQRPGRPVVGFHISAIYSPFVTWETMARKWIDAQGDHQLLQFFINSFLGESWELRGKEAAPGGLLARCGLRWPNPKILPPGVGLLTCAVDTQQDRLEWQVEGWGEGEENWKVEYGVVLGDTIMLEPWKELDGILRRTWRHATGLGLPIRCTVVDAGDGKRTRDVYAFTRPRYRRRVYAVKGLSKGDARGLVRKAPTVDDKTGTRFFLFSPNTAKDTVFGRLKITTPGPRYVNLPDAPWCDQTWADGVLSEELFERKGKEVYEKVRERNEPLDLCVMNLVALGLSGVPVDRLGRRADRLAQQAKEDEITPTHPDAVPGDTGEEVEPLPPARVYKRRRVKPRHSWIRDT